MTVPDKQRGTNIGSKNKIQVELLSTFSCPCCSTTLKLGRWICSQRKIPLCGRVACQASKAPPAAGNAAGVPGSWPGLSDGAHANQGSARGRFVSTRTAQHLGYQHSSPPPAPGEPFVRAKCLVKGADDKAFSLNWFLQKCVWCQYVMWGGSFAWNIRGISFHKKGYWRKGVGWNWRTDMIKRRRILLCWSPLWFFSLQGDIQKREHNAKAKNTKVCKDVLQCPDCSYTEWGLSEPKRMPFEVGNRRSVYYRIKLGVYGKCIAYYWIMLFVRILQTIIENKSPFKLLSKIREGEKRIIRGCNFCSLIHVWQIKSY